MPYSLLWPFLKVSKAVRLRHKANNSIMARRDGVLEALT